jgi:hypothetical protein
VVKHLVGVGGEFIMLRITMALAAMLAAGPAAAEQLNVESARQFVVGKLFAFNCFEGTHGAGRIYVDGSVAGTASSAAADRAATWCCQPERCGPRASRSAPR